MRTALDSGCFSEIRKRLDRMNNFFGLASDIELVSRHLHGLIVHQEQQCECESAPHGPLAPRITQPDHGHHPRRWLVPDGSGHGQRQRIRMGVAERPVPKRGAIAILPAIRGIGGCAGTESGEPPLVATGTAASDGPPRTRIQSITLSAGSTASFTRLVHGAAGPGRPSGRW